MKQKLFSFASDFTIEDEVGDHIFQVAGKALSLRDAPDFRDMAGYDLAYIRQRLLSWGPTHEIYRGGDRYGKT